jgi:hypothetical protein
MSSTQLAWTIGAGDWGSACLSGGIRFRESVICLVVLSRHVTTGMNCALGPKTTGTTKTKCVDLLRELFALHLPNHGRVEADFAVLAGLSRELSGGDILNVCLNAIHAGSVDADPAKWRVTQVMLEREIVKARAAREEHCGKKRRKMVIGFGGQTSLPQPDYLSRDSMRRCQEHELHASKQ